MQFLPAFICVSHHDDGAKKMFEPLPVPSSVSDRLCSSLDKYIGTCLDANLWHILALVLSLLQSQP